MNEVSPRVLAEMLPGGGSERTVRRYCESGQLPGVRKRGARWWIDPDKALPWLMTQTPKLSFCQPVQIRPLPPRPPAAPAHRQAPLADEAVARRTTIEEIAEEAKAQEIIWEEMTSLVSDLAKGDFDEDFGPEDMVILFNGYRELHKNNTAFVHDIELQTLAGLIVRDVPMRQIKRLVAGGFVCSWDQTSAVRAIQTALAEYADQATRRLTERHLQAMNDHRLMLESDPELRVALDCPVTPLHLPD